GRVRDDRAVLRGRPPLQHRRGGAGAGAPRAARRDRRLRRHRSVSGGGPAGTERDKERRPAMRRDDARTERPEARLTRRQLLKLAAASGALGATLPLPGDRGRAWGQTPRAGGTLKMAWASSPRTIDPALTIQGDEYMITQNVYDNLTRVDERLQVQPMLATRWSSDPQARVWTFTLRPGVKFHHGRELKASDVVFTFER